MSTSMTSRFQASTLVSSPSYPNSIAWSDENLIAVACGHLVTILNPALPFGPRGLVKVPSTEPFQIGMIKREELLSSCLLPTCLSRDHDPCVRSISWSPLGMAPNGGCLLAICTTEGHVKIYRPPFCDFSAQWIEVLDISDMLLDYILNSCLHGSEIPSSDCSDDAEDKYTYEPSNSGPRTEHKRKRLRESGIMIQCKSKGPRKSREKSSPRRTDNADLASFENDEMQPQGSPKMLALQLASGKGLESCKKVSKSYKKSSKKKIESSMLPMITADEYASRIAMLSCLVISWSPILQCPIESCSNTENSATVFSLLAIGGKSGKVSLWKVNAPHCYSIEHADVPPAAAAVAILQAHSSWVTAISWALLTHDPLNPQVLLCTGSSDGSVKIWLAHSSEFVISPEGSSFPFILLKEIIAADDIPVSVLSLTVPCKFPHKQLLAVGKGSGSFEVWISDKSSSSFTKIGSYEAHAHIVTGLAWAFDGCCLYSCSQDNMVRSWMFLGNTLCEIPIPSDIPGQKRCFDVPNVFHSCFGLAISPGNLVVAMVRSFDADLLNPMYQARSQKAAVDFFFLIGQKHDLSSSTSEKIRIGALSGFSEKEMACWKFNMLWSLKQCECFVKPLVVWDIIAALQAFNRSVPQLVDDILVEWLSVSFIGSHSKVLRDKILADFSQRLLDLTSRHLHLLNVICRRAILCEEKADDINSNEDNPGKGENEEDVMFWKKLLLLSEKELQERLVGLCLASSSFPCQGNAKISPSDIWHPTGLAQMEQWVRLGQVQDQLRRLASEVNIHGKSLDFGDRAMEEQCPYCSASVPFKTPGVAFCRGVNNDNNERHKLDRCAVSMEICPPSPLWFCICCHRWASKLAPEPLFTMARRPEDFKSFVASCRRGIASKPLCPFCGILLQRLQPEFLLSTVPV